MLGSIKSVESGYEQECRSNITLEAVWKVAISDESILILLGSDLSWIFPAEVSENDVHHRRFDLVRPMSVLGCTSLTGSEKLYHRVRPKCSLVQCAGSSGCAQITRGRTIMMV